MASTSRGRRTLVTLLTVAVLAVGGTAAVKTLRGPVVVQPRCTAVANGQSHELAPDQAANAALISAIAVKRRLPARAATIGIATAIQESKLRNIDYGDRDSLGLFQQRPSQGWGSPEQLMDPIYATNAFYDVLVKIEGFEGLEITDAAQRVQRSAFGQAYRDHEPEGRAFASALTGYSPAALTCRLRPASDLPAEQAGANGLTARAAAVLTAATAQLGALRATPDGADGRSVRVTIGDDDNGRRRAWALAQWAVAGADELDIQRVLVDGKVWDRGEPDDGWAPADDAQRAGSGEVLVEVASG